MKPENIKFLEHIKPFYNKLNLGGDIHLQLDERRKLQEIIREEWDKNYSTCLTCPEGVKDLLKMAYNNYNEYLNKQPPPEDQLTEEAVDPPIKMTFPKHGPLPPKKKGK